METHFPTIRKLFVVTALTFLLFIVIELFWGGFQNKGKILLLEGVTVIPAIIYVLVVGFPFREVFKWRKVRGDLLLVSGILGLGLSIFLDEIDRLIQMVFPMKKELLDAMEEFLVVRSPGDLIFVVLTVIVVASFAEEMLFRGLFQGTLERNMDATKAVAVTSVAFAVLHFNPWWFIEILILGTVLGFLAWRSGSLFPCVVVHAINNGLSVYFINTNTSRLDWYLFKGHVSPIWILVSAGCILLGVRLFGRMSK